MKKFFIFIIIIAIIGLGIFIYLDTQEKQVYLSELEPDYVEVGYYDLGINKDYDNDPLSLKVDGTEKVYNNGFFVHAHSTLVFDNLKSYHPKKLSITMGVNKTARDNGNTNMRFMIYFDQELVFESEEIKGNSEAIFIELEMQNIDRITLVVDDLNGNGNDHAVWAEPLLTYRGVKELV